MPRTPISTPFVPRLASALLAFLALGFAWSLWRHGTPFRPWAVGLGLLGLPMASSLQFYLGYPLRIASGAVALVLLRLGGVAVDREGVYLRAGGELVMIDAPCSGMRMLWAALLLACCLAALFRLRARSSLLAVGAAALLAVLGNGLRTAALFWADTNAPQLPAYLARRHRRGRVRHARGRAVRGRPRPQRRGGPRMRAMSPELYLGAVRAGGARRRCCRAPRAHDPPTPPRRRSRPAPGRPGSRAAR